MPSQMTPPAPDEYGPFYEDYIRRVRDRDVLEVLPAQIDEIRSELGRLTDSQALYRNGPNEWSIKEVTGHLIDVERVFSYRLLRVARGDKTPLPGFDQEEYVRQAGFDQCRLAHLIQEFEFLRRANLLTINNLPDQALLQRGTASDAPVSTRALVYMLAGHVDHHMESLKTKYLPAIK